MKDDQPQELSSKVAIAKHPLHPMLIPFPIAYLIGAFAADFCYWWTADPFWARGALWLVGAGLIMGAVAAIAGMLDFLLVSGIRQFASSWSHFITAIMVLSLASLNLVLRLDNPQMAVWPWGLFVSAITAFVVLAAGWLGAELTFEHNIGTD